MSTSRTYAAGAVLTAAQQNDLEQGTIGYAQAVANQTGIAATQTDLTSLASAVTVVAGRRIRISAFAQVIQNTSGQTSVFQIQEGATVLQIAKLTLTTGFLGFYTPSVVIQPSAGAHTYKLTLSTPGGTIDVQASATQPAYILVEDIGI